MISIQTVIEFEAAHRQMYDTGKCKNLHGHNWKVDLTLTGEPIGRCNYLVDFKDLKTLFDQYDHSCILQQCDPLKDLLVFYGMKVIATINSPSCETLCDEFASIILKNYPNVQTVSLTVWENERSRASTISYQTGFVQPLLDTFGVANESE